MIANDGANISLDDVRARFMEAESTLVQLAATLQSLDASRAQLEGARADLSTSRGALVDVSARVGTTLQGVGDATRLIQRAVSTLEASEPGQIRARMDGLTAELARVSTLIVAMHDGVGSIPETVPARVGSLIRDDLHRVSTAFDRLQQVLESAAAERDRTLQTSLNQSLASSTSALGAELASIQSSLDTAATTARTESESHFASIRERLESTGGALASQLQQARGAVEVLASENRTAFAAISVAQERGRQSTERLLWIAILLSVAGCALGIAALLR